MEAKRILKSGEQVFGTPGASLTWGIEGSDGGQVTAGGEGEKQVAKELDKIVAKYPNAKVFHSVEWPGSVGDTDHMLVIGNTVLIIDAKRWKAKRKYSVTPKGEILRGTVPFPEGKVKMMPAMKAWRTELGKKARVLGMVCIAQEEVFVPYDQNWAKAPYRLVTAERFEEFMDKFIAKQKPENLNANNDEILLTIATRVIKARNRRRELINLDAMRRP
ncbi:MAG: NERD domain-containing protein [Enterococcus sp.]|nr:NERD domain-containing protein [Enterococcus sp.]